MGRYSAALCPTVGVAISSTFGWSLPAHHRDAYQHQMSLSQSLRMDSGEHVEEFLYADIGGLGEVAADFLAFMLPQHSKYRIRNRYKTASKAVDTGQYLRVRTATAVHTLRRIIFQRKRTISKTA